MRTSTDTLTALGDGGDAIRVLSGDCTVIADGDRRAEYRGHVTVVIKPDNTVLVHDATGYQPVAWLTRADAVSCSRGRRRARSTDARRAWGPPPDADDGDRAAGLAGGAEAAERADGARAEERTDGIDAGVESGTSTDATVTATDGAAFAVDAQDGDARLRVRAHAEDGYAAYPATRAGRPVGSCPDCSGTLVTAGRAVTCIRCGTDHGLPDGATVREQRCSCGLPRIRVERGAPLDVCLDRTCEPLLAAVRERFDREWTCPRCGSDLRVLRRGGLIAGCESYPDCEVSYSIPTGTVVGDCECGLPVFETARSRRCLDSTCSEGEGDEGGE